MNKEREIKLLNQQQICLVIFTISIIISIYIAEISKNNIKNSTNVNTYNLDKLNRYTILIITIAFLCINYNFFNINKEKGKNFKPFEIQLFISSITVIAAILAIYVLELNNSLANIENPIA